MAAALAALTTPATLLLTLTASSFLTTLITLTARRLLTTLLTALIFLTIVCHYFSSHVRFVESCSGSKTDIDFNAAAFIQNRLQRFLYV
jgi:hypothetical protein